MYLLNLLFFLSLYFSAILLVTMVFFSYANKRKKNRYLSWDKETNHLINEYLFAEKNRVIELSENVKELSKTKPFRDFIAKKIIIAVKTFSGETTRNLKKLYLLLKLNEDTLYNSKHVFWYLKARAIRNAGIMKLDNFHDIIFENTNHKNDLIRIESQIALIRLIGFDGLKFLNIITYPISEWYQIVLLKELKVLDPDHFKGIKFWLKSYNKSVIIFALKLIGSFHLFDFYTDTQKLLQHKNKKVRLQAIQSISKIFKETTATELFAIFDKEPIENKTAILKEISKFKDPNTIEPLLKLLHSENPSLKTKIAKTIITVDKNGIALLEKQSGANAHPLNTIISQLKEETNS
ncbi:HEAT repeat domain-containing protein [Wenyingzhuangia aestuarii]|uniref:HEAT repeat domain-containing protein n=1 Tax=Wenyingzhuangia aestuarii TaxID=1647582 RepID=UPI00143A3185|nr:HEAT repeat domain-containing protein [Wenyingzhuangia aestuarii]NJB83024.1 hypothetical protein [Wenyingzhuangia aestuarii]